MTEFIRKTIALPFVALGVALYLFAAFAMHFADAISGQRWSKDLFGF